MVAKPVGYGGELERRLAALRRTYAGIFKSGQVVVLLDSAVQSSAVQCSPVLYSAVQCSPVLYSAVQSSTVQSSVVHLAGYHEGGEVGGVDGEEHHGEERPDGGHEAGGEAAGAVHLSGQYRCSTGAAASPGRRPGKEQPRPASRCGRGKT